MKNFGGIVVVVVVVVAVNFGPVVSVWFLVKCADDSNVIDFML